MEGKKIHVVINKHIECYSLESSLFWMVHFDFCATLSYKQSTVCDTGKQMHINLNLL